VSGGAVFRESLRRLRRAELPEEAERDVVSALEAGRAGNGPLQFVYDAGTEAGLAREEILCRGAAVFFSFCAGNLADDPPTATASPRSAIRPADLQFILQHLSSEAFLDQPSREDSDHGRALARAVACSSSRCASIDGRSSALSSSRRASPACNAAYLCALWSTPPDRALSVDVPSGSRRVAMDLRRTSATRGAGATRVLGARGPRCPGERCAASTRRSSRSASSGRT
jgi:hypothetical protein